MANARRKRNCNLKMVCAMCAKEINDKVQTEYFVYRDATHPDIWALPLILFQQAC